MMLNNIVETADVTNGKWIGCGVAVVRYYYYYYYHGSVSRVTHMINKNYYYYYLFSIISP